MMGVEMDEVKWKGKGGGKWRCRKERGNSTISKAKGVRTGARKNELCAIYESFKSSNFLIFFLTS